MYDAFRSASVLLVPALLAAAAPAQESAFRETVEVELVEVDALVTDAEGHPVLDLTRADFRLFDDGHPVEITHFLAPGGTAINVPGAGPAASGSDPSDATVTAARLVVFLDELHLTLRSRHLVFGRIQQVLTQELARTTEVMLASYDGTVEVIHPFTRDHRGLLKLLDDRLSRAGRATSDDLEAQSLMRQLPRIVEAALAPPDHMESACSVAGGMVRGQAQRVLGRVSSTIGALDQFVASLAAYPGPKTVLYVSDGLPLVAGQEIYDYLIELCDGSLVSSSADPTLQALATYEPARKFPTLARVEMVEFGSHELWAELAAEANTRRVTIHTIQASGLQPSRRATVDGAPASFATETFGERNLQDSLVLMAEETGGRAIVRTNDVTAAVTEAIDLDAARYLLAFSSAHPADDKVHRLRLEVDRPGVELRYRRSYKSRTADQRVVDGVLASLHHGFEDNGHEIRVAAERLEDRRVSLEVRVPLSSLVLLPEAEASRGLFTVFVAALDASGLGTGIRRKSVAVRTQETDGDHTVRTVLDLEEAREYVLAVAVRDELGAITSFTTTRVRGR